MLCLAGSVRSEEPARATGGSAVVADAPSATPSSSATTIPSPEPTPVATEPAVPAAPAVPTPERAVLPATRAAPMAASEPLRVLIPAIGVDSTLMDLGLESDGTMEVPPRGFPAGWYTGAPTPGQLGPAIIVGHVDWAGRPGVFHDLGTVRAGDEVDVARADGTTAVFRVREVEQVAKDAFPTERVYGDLDHAGLRLVTCGGSFDRATGHYRDNVVVYADLVATRSG